MEPVSRLTFTFLPTPVATVKVVPVANPIAVAEIPISSPHIRLHTHTVVVMLPQERKLQLYSLRVSILDPDQPLMRNPLVILLRLVNEVTPRDSPALNLLRQWDRSEGRQLRIVGYSQGKICHDLVVTNAIGPQLKGADGQAAMSRFPTEGFEGVGLYTQRDARSGIGGLYFLGASGNVYQRRISIGGAGGATNPRTGLLYTALVEKGALTASGFSEELASACHKQLWASFQ